MVMDGELVAEQLQERRHNVENNVVGEEPVLSAEYREYASEQIITAKFYLPGKEKDERYGSRIESCFKDYPQCLLDRKRTCRI